MLDVSSTHLCLFKLFQSIFYEKFRWQPKYCNIPSFSWTNNRCTKKGAASFNRACIKCHYAGGNIIQPKYRNYLRQVTDTSCGIQAPDVNFASSGNQLTIASGTLGRCNQFHQENLQVQSSIPSSSIHTSTGYLTGDFINQGNVQPHQQNDEDEMSNSELPWWL